jgi:Protein of unknown function (DUF2510)
MSLLRRPIHAGPGHFGWIGNHGPAAGGAVRVLPTDPSSDGGSPASTSMDYLRRANGYLRKSVIAFACINQVMTLPCSRAEEFGRPLAGSTGLRPAADLVRSIMFQDRSMAAWTARDCLVTLDALLCTMHPSWDDALDTAMSAAGLLPGPTIDPRRLDGVKPGTRQDVLVLANRVISVFFAFERPNGNRCGDRTFYERLFAANSTAGALAAYEIAAWTGTVIGRLRDAGYLDEVLWMSQEFRTVPEMTVAGWYPNPFRMGEIVGGEAGWQRFWDGSDWTERVRTRYGTGWREATTTMFQAPAN